MLSQDRDFQLIGSTGVDAAGTPSASGATFSGSGGSGSKTLDSAGIGTGSSLGGTGTSPASTALSFALESHVDAEFDGTLCSIGVDGTDVCGLAGDGASDCGASYCKVVSAPHPQLGETSLGNGTGVDIQLLFVSQKDWQPQPDGQVREPPSHDPWLPHVEPPQPHCPA